MKESHAQFGEDIIVLSYFGPEKKGTFVEVGAFMPDALSQTFLLEQHGWHGVLIEPQSKLCEELRAKRIAKVYEVACGTPEQAGRQLTFRVNDALSQIVEADAGKAAPDLIHVSVETLDKVLADAGVAHVDFLSIDTEGSELDVLRGFNLRRYHPELIIIEDHGENLSKYRYLTANGYRLVKRTGCNDWYVPGNVLRFPTSLRERIILVGRTLRTWFRSAFS